MSDIGADFRTPEFKFDVASDLGDQAFLLSCAVQVVEEIPGSKVKNINPVLILNALLYLFEHWDDVEAFIEKMKSWWSALWNRRAFRAAINQSVAAAGMKQSVDTANGIQAWLMDQGNAASVRRIRRIAKERSGK